MSKNYVTKLEKDSFTLDDGRIFDFPFEIDEHPSLEEFNKIYGKRSHQNRNKK